MAGREQRECAAALGSPAVVSGDVPGRGVGTSGVEIEWLLASFVRILPGDDAAVSVLGAPHDALTLAATSRRAATLDEMQIDLGEGPAWDAHRTDRATEMLLDDERHSAVWPVFGHSAEAAGVRAALAVPLLVGTSSIGAVTLYSSAAMRLDAQQLQLAGRLAGTLARAVAEQIVSRSADDMPVRDPAFSRREVHRATEMVMSQMRSTPADALVVIRAHAFAESIGVRDVAALVIERALDFSRDPPA
ncbi:GAF and ANTAR domain-containing protein [Rathayibacter sp. VKM Ac-2760]|uniref:GAF and ANTAR domain-containing protein n=1 Tax=Rathayibacter sp. VKM Ac-2760 TaxID=2609253 RepID=UPI0013163B65|nr:GAF and ANTAR domain-containing protein [Rathayibacter sp. VKM Ac-2760]QHC58759.1 GAF domain-containing protein [Rathayibacter sp. VKM Ac-2760]